LHGQKEKFHELEHFFLQLEFKSSYYPQKAKQELNLLLKESSDKDLTRYTPHIEFIKAQFYFNDLQMDSSLNHLEKSISYFSSEENKLWLAKSQLLLGQIAEVSGLFEQAKINYYESLKLFKGFEDDNIGLAYCGIARSKKALHEIYDEDLDRGIDVLKVSKHEEIRLFGEFMQCWDILKEEVAPQRLNDLAKKYIERGLYERAVNVYKILASRYFAKKQISQAVESCDKAIDLSKTYEVGELIIPALYQFKGVLMYHKDKLALSQDYFEKAISLYKSHGQENRIPYALDYLHKIELKKENYQMAYKYLDEYNKINKEIIVSDKIRLAKVLEVNNKVELMKSQLAQLRVEKKASEFMLYLVIVITIAILGAVSVYVYLYQKNKKAKIEELNKEFHNILIGIGEKRLLEHRLKDKLKANDLINMDIKTDTINGVSEMADSFDSCYMETINLFTDAFPQLTKTEVRYSVMMCLKLPVEVIAKVQNVQPSSIRKAKQRIRTKLDVDGNLENYLQEYREKQISDLSS